MTAVRCMLCGAARYALVYHKPKLSAAARRSSSYSIAETHLDKPDKIVRCLTCGLIYAFHDCPLDEITKDYELMVDQAYLEEDRGRREQARRVLAQIARHKRPPGRLLDLGCGPGLFLDEARKAGWEVSGLDVSPWARDYAQSHFGIEVSLKKAAEAYPERSFDVITLNDVIEHLADPKTELKEIRWLLKNDGVLYVSTPDIDSVLSRVLRARWWGINKYHLYYFSRETLGKLLFEVGFKRLKYYPYPRVFSVGYWVKRLKDYPVFVRKPMEALAHLGRAREALLPITLHDQIGLAARKVQRLDTIAAEDGPRPGIEGPRPRVVAVLPAYNAQSTLERTVTDIDRSVVDEIILVDDSSRDRTVQIAKKLGLKVFEHASNRGYGANQKTCYDKALEAGAEIVIMVHPDYQYDPRIIPQLIGPIARGEADAGMPLWKHNANILLTAFENMVLGTYLTEYHSGFRAYSARLLRRVNYHANSDGFVFDTEIIVQALANHFKIDEVPIRTRYFEEASSIRLGPSIVYGLGILRVMAGYALHRRGIQRNKKYEARI